MGKKLIYNAWPSSFQAWTFVYMSCGKERRQDSTNEIQDGMWAWKGKVGSLWELFHVLLPEEEEDPFLQDLWWDHRPQILLRSSSLPSPCLLSLRRVGTREQIVSIADHKLALVIATSFRTKAITSVTHAILEDQPGTAKPSRACLASLVKVIQTP